MKNFTVESRQICEMYTQCIHDGDYERFVGDLLWLDRYETFTRALFQFGGPTAGFDVCNGTRNVTYWRAWGMEYFEITILDNDFIDFVLEYIEGGAV